MKMFFLKESRIIVSLLLLLVLPGMLQAQAEPDKAGPPPIGHGLVREGDFAVKLQLALGVGNAEDEVEAESRLAEAGVAPRNGWIADYPVTPDIISELYKSVSDAVDGKKLLLGKDDALKRLNDTSVELGVGVRPAESVKPEGKTAGAENRPSQTVINNYYNIEGPPVVTYYTPPPDYHYMYAWVPSPFWVSGIWFPGFFILNDFHRTIIVNRRVVFISNHFNDVRNHRVFRIDPVARFGGRTYAGIGGTRTRGFISTGVPRSERQIFNGPRTRMVPAGRVVSPAPRVHRSNVAPSHASRAVTPRSGGSGVRVGRGERR